MLHCYGFKSGMALPQARGKGGELDVKRKADSLVCNKVTFILL